MAQAETEYRVTFREHAGPQDTSSSVSAPDLVFQGRIGCHAKRERVPGEAARTLMTTQEGQPKFWATEPHAVCVRTLRAVCDCETRDLDTQPGRKPWYVATSG
jgi:hypothetical protein